MKKCWKGNPVKAKFCSLCFCSKEKHANRKLHSKFASGLVSELTLAAEEGCQNCSLVLDAIATWWNDQIVNPSWRFKCTFRPKSLQTTVVDEINTENIIEILFSPRNSDFSENKALRICLIYMHRVLCDGGPDTCNQFLGTARYPGVIG